MKALISLALTLTCTAVAAQGSFSDAHEVEKVCDTHGSAARTDYEIKELFGSNREGSEAKARATLDGQSLKMRLFAIDYVARRATSERDAYMAAWSYCQDVLREPKTKGKTSKSK